MKPQKIAQGEVGSREGIVVRDAHADQHVLVPRQRVPAKKRDDTRRQPHEHAWVNESAAHVFPESDRLAQVGRDLLHPILKTSCCLGR